MSEPFAGFWWLGYLLVVWNGAVLTSHRVRCYTLDKTHGTFHFPMKRFSKLTLAAIVVWSLLALIVVAFVSWVLWSSYAEDHRYDRQEKRERKAFSQAIDDDLWSVSEISWDVIGSDLNLTASDQALNNSRATAENLSEIGAVEADIAHIYVTFPQGKTIEVSTQGRSIFISADDWETVFEYLELEDVSGVEIAEADWNNNQEQGFTMTADGAQASDLQRVGKPLGVERLKAGE